MVKHPIIMSIHYIIMAVTAFGLGAAATPVRADPAPTLQLQLNKLEEASGSCRAYLVFDNAGPALAAYKLDLVVFGKDGVIARRLALDAGPLRAARPTVKLFELAGLPCEGVGSILVNDILSCRDEAGEHADCLDRLATASKTATPLRK